MMTDEQYQAHVKRIEEAKKKGDKKKASELSKALWDILAESVTF
jgi:type III secretory pathway component EscU